MCLSRNNDCCSLSPTVALSFYHYNWLILFQHYLEIKEKIKLNEINNEKENGKRDKQGVFR